MRELVAKSGVTKASIQYYIKEGLVPKPIKIRANSAFYTEDHLNDIRLVKELQTKRFLPLSVIKQVMRGGVGELSVDEKSRFMEIDGKLFRNLKENTKSKPVTARQLSEQTGVSLRDIRAMERIKILHPIKQGKRKLYEEDDIRLVEYWGRALQAGFIEALDVSVDDLKILRELWENIVEEETRFFIKHMSGKVEAEKIIRMVEEGATIFENMGKILHRKIITETTSKYTLELRRKDS
jgi:DNA-binding transcriptional MerR regulator